MHVHRHTHTFGALTLRFSKLRILCSIVVKVNFMGFRASLPASLLVVEGALLLPAAELVSQFFPFWPVDEDAAATQLLVLSLADLLLAVSTLLFPLPLLVAAAADGAVLFLLDFVVKVSVIFLLLPFPLTPPATALVPLGPPEFIEFTEDCFTSLVFD